MNFLAAGGKDSVQSPLQAALRRRDPRAKEEREAAEEGVALDTSRLELSKVERAFIDGEEEGFAEIYTRKGTGQIAGATLVAAHAGEMISELTLAITSKLTMEALAETVHCYPTQAEVFQRIALEYLQSVKQTAKRWAA